MISVILLSFNRPNLLQKALASCKDAAEIFIMDDGSDYDVVTVARAVRADVNVYAGRARIPTEHVHDMNFGRFLAAATKLVTTPYVAYLCDDDYFAEGWLKKACEYLVAGNSVVVGDVVSSNGRAFHSLAEGKFCLGNFALRMNVFRQVKWANSSWSPENQLWNEITNAGIPILKVDEPALHALQHPHNLSNWGEISHASTHWESFCE